MTEEERKELVDDLRYRGSLDRLMGDSMWRAASQIETDGKRIEDLEAENERLRDALVQADLKIRSFPGADQSDVEALVYSANLTAGLSETATAPAAVAVAGAVAALCKRQTILGAVDEQ